MVLKTYPVCSSSLASASETHSRQRRNPTMTAAHVSVVPAQQNRAPGAPGVWFCCVDGCDCSTWGDGWLTIYGALLLNDKTLVSASVQPKALQHSCSGGVRRQQTESFDSRSSDAHIQAIRGKSA